MRKNPHKDVLTQKAELMPMQTKYDQIPVFRGDKAFVLSAYPIFGGVDDPKTDPATTTTTKTDPPATTTTTDPPAGGDADKAAQAAAEAAARTAELAKNPEAINQLLKQITDLQGESKAHKEALAKHEAEKLKAERATQTREQQLEADLTIAQETVKQMDEIVRTVAAQSAFITAGDFQWNSVKQAMSELSDDEYEIDVDLETRKATVTGIENAVKRIARECPWLLKTAGDAGGGTSTAPRRGTGAPPAPPTGAAGAQAKRADMMKRFPAIVGR